MSCVIVFAAKVWYTFCAVDVRSTTGVGLRSVKCTPGESTNPVAKLDEELEIETGFGSLE